MHMERIRNFRDSDDGHLGIYWMERENQRRRWASWDCWYSVIGVALIPHVLSMSNSDEGHFLLVYGGRDML